MQLRKSEINGGRVLMNGAHTRLMMPLTLPRKYTNAQLDDYAGMRRGRFPHSPPVSLSVRARASHAQPTGTLGFGFWNDPFTISGGVLAAPNVVWFFYASPPSDMALAEGVPGYGWKAATLHAGKYPTVLLAPAALAAIALTKIPGLGAPIMAAARRAAPAHEKLLEVPLTEWHHYELDWLAEEAVFRVDGAEVLRAPAPPRGPLGLVLWIDNQYAVASRAGRFGFGVCEVKEEQWLEVEGLDVSDG
jgi:hypothetical protein